MLSIELLSPTHPSDRASGGCVSPKTYVPGGDCSCTNGELIETIPDICQSGDDEEVCQAVCGSYCDEEASCDAFRAAQPSAPPGTARGPRCLPVWTTVPRPPCPTSGPGAAGSAMTAMQRSASIRLCVMGPTGVGQSESVLRYAT
eukprot:scaffold382075_cov36-Prasinocladus_malaysianus.AAC.1